MKKINILLILILLVSTFAIHVKEANACSWLYQTASERLVTSDLVFKGTVTAFTKTTAVIDGTKNDVHKITLNANTTWKGNPGKTITVTSSMPSGTSCFPASAVVGKEYVIYAHKGTNGYTVNEIEVQDAAFLQDDFKALGAGTKIGATATTTTTVGAAKPVIAATTTATPSVPETPVAPVEKQSIFKRFFRWLSNLF